MIEGEPFIQKSSPKMERLGSNRNAVASLEAAGADDFYELLQRTSFKSFYTEDRIRVYDHIDRLYGDADNTEELDQVIQYAASEAVLWVTEEQFAKRPYRDSESATAYEIHERVSMAHDVLVNSTYNKALTDKESVSGGITLGLALQGALAKYELWAEKHGSIDFDRKISEIKEVSSVCLISCFDAISDLPPKDALSVQGEKPLHDYYLEQFKYLTVLEDSEGPSVIIDEFGDSIIEKVLKAASDPRTSNLTAADLAFLSNNARGSLLKSELIDKAINQLDMNNLENKDLETVVLISSSVNDLDFKKELLDTAYEATRAYSFEHAEAQSSMFGWIGKLINTPQKPLSTYEKRTSILAGNVKDNLGKLLLEYPEHIQHVVELHSPSDHDSIWYGLAESMISLCSGRNSHGAEAIQQMTKIQAAFKSIAPEGPFDHAKEEIDQRFPEGR